MASEFGVDKSWSWRAELTGEHEQTSHLAILGRDDLLDKHWEVAVERKKCMHLPHCPSQFLWLHIWDSTRKPDRLTWVNLSLGHLKVCSTRVPPVLTLTIQKGKLGCVWQKVVHEATERCEKVRAPQVDLTLWEPVLLTQAKTSIRWINKRLVTSHLTPIRQGNDYMLSFSSFLNWIVISCEPQQTPFGFGTLLNCSHPPSSTGLGTSHSIFPPPPPCDATDVLIAALFSQRCWLT